MLFVISSIFMLYKLFINTLDFWVTGNEALLSVIAVGAKDGSKWNLQGQEGQLPTKCPKTFCGHKAQWVFVLFFSLSLETQFLCCVFLLFSVYVCSKDGEEINPKVLQALGNDKMKVGWILG